MPVQDLNYQGINRAISDYASSQACEELINLRPTSNGLVPVKPFSVKMANVDYDKVYVHKIGDGQNYIAVKFGPNSTVIYRISETGAILSTLHTINIANLSAEDIHFATAGNIFLISVAKHSTPTAYQNISYIWKSGYYQQMEADIPDGVMVNLSSFSPVVSSAVASIDIIQYVEHEGTVIKRIDSVALADSIQNGINGVEASNKYMCLGPFIVAIAFKIKGGDTFWTGRWFVYDPIPFINANASPRFIHTRGDGQPENDYFTQFFSQYTLGYYYGGTSNYYLYGAEITMSLPQIYNWNKETSIIESVEIYTSRPISYIDPEIVTRENVEVGLDNTSDPTINPYFALMLPQRPYEEMGLERQLLYHQKSILLSDLASGAQSFKLEFGGNIQTTNKTLETDAGMVTRYGELLSYNSRFHFYNSVSKTQIAMPRFMASGANTYAQHVYVTYNNGEKEQQFYVGEAYLPLGTPVNLVIAHPIGVRRVTTYYPGPAGGIGSYIIDYEMTESTTYNFTIFSGVKQAPMSIGRSNVLDNLYYQGVQTDRFKDEPSALNVTEEYNPFLFKVEHSYLAPGKILDVQPQMVAVTDVEFGDYPLNVFTDRGVYALLQGSGKVLYGNWRHISNLIITDGSGGGRGGGRSIPTESGTFFLAAGGLWAIVGARAVLISDALHEGPHKYIRQSDGYQDISMGGEGIYDVTTLHSLVTFLIYTGNAALSYNRYRDELYVSNPGYDYTYALSLKYRQWFKLAQTLHQDVNGGDVINTPAENGTMNILDLSAEQDTSVLVHLQSRPFSFNYMYSHVHRIVSMIRAGLTANNKIVVALYGSDDLQNWKLLTYSLRQNVEVSQIRTSSSARSWRYYTVCIGGYCPTDADLGPVLVDYQPVIRRIG